MCVFFSEIYLFESCFSHLYKDEVGFLVTAVNFLGSRWRMGPWEDTRFFLQLILHPVWGWRIEGKVDR